MSNSRKEQDRLNSLKRLWVEQVKWDALIHYSGTNPPRCTDPYRLHLPNDPFLTLFDTLTIDHINNDGAEERRKIRGDRRQGGGYMQYSRLRKANWPIGYQVLCMNCQFKKESLRRAIH